jgi:hypothetical protein
LPNKDFETDVANYFAAAREVLLSKHRDYGAKNIAHAPGGAVNGLRVRLHDKLARLNNLYDSDVEPNHESLVDTALDIANYGIILGMVLNGDWPNDT